jgi:hypothetical protein
MIEVALYEGWLLSTRSPAVFSAMRMWQVGLPVDGLPWGWVGRAPPIRRQRQHIQRAHGRCCLVGGASVCARMGGYTVAATLQMLLLALIVQFVSS